MALIASDNSSDFKRVPPGVHQARCFSVVDLGTQQFEYKGEPKAGRKIQISWELYGEDDDGAKLVTDEGLPMSISKRYTLSLSDKSRLRPDLEAWRGRPFTPEELKGFELELLLGVPCMLNVTHTEKDGKTYANIASITPLPKALRDVLPPMVNPKRIYVITDGKNEVYKSLHDKLRETIDKAVEFKGLTAHSEDQPPPPNGEGALFDDDITF